jgi:hypothetical protein
MLREYCIAHIHENCIISFCNVSIINCANDNDSGFTSGNPTGRISWSRLVTNPTSWIIADCMPDGLEWKDPSKIQIDDIYCLLDHWKACQDSRLELLVWASTGPLFQDNNKTAKNLQASQHTHTLQPPDSDEEVFVLPDSDDIDLDNEGDHSHLEDAPHFDAISGDDVALSMDALGSDVDMDHSDNIISGRSH